MTELASPARPARPEFRNIHAVADLPSYRLPPAGWVSILHRISGAILFVLMPFIIWMFDTSVSSEISFARFTAVFRIGTEWAWSSFLFWTFNEPKLFAVPGWFYKLLALAIIWSYLHHFIAGVRHLWMDATHSVSKEFGKSSAIVTLVLGTLLTLVLAAKLFGLY